MEVYFLVLKKMPFYKIVHKNRTSILKSRSNSVRGLTNYSQVPRWKLGLQLHLDWSLPATGQKAGANNAARH